MSHGPRLSKLLIALLVGGVGVVVAPPARAATQTVKKTFNMTGAAQTWKVPSGVTGATFTLYGAAGGDFCNNTTGCLLGGNGAKLRATIPVTPAERLTIMVGSNPYWTHDFGGEGGFNGGGDGGADGESKGGGGASDVRRGGSGLEHRVLVAAGGGGTAEAVCSLCGELGGAGGDSGRAGKAGDGGTAGKGGRPGTQDGGGEGGAAGDGSAQDGVPGNPGALGVGGNGGEENIYRNSGGGGGGGYFGGGGGGSGGEDFTDGMFFSYSGGGGGGGSSFSPPGAIGVVLSEGFQRGNGLVEVTFNQPEYRLTVAVKGNGLVKSADRLISCGADCTEDYLSDTRVRLTARPQEGFAFSHWTGACRAVTTSACTVVMNFAKSTTAVFVRA